MNFEFWLGYDILEVVQENSEERSYTYMIPNINKHVFYAYMSSATNKNITRTHSFIHFIPCGLWKYLSFTLSEFPVLTLSDRLLISALIAPRLPGYLSQVVVSRTSGTIRENSIEFSPPKNSGDTFFESVLGKFGPTGTWIHAPKRRFSPMASTLPKPNAALYM